MHLYLVAAGEADPGNLSQHQHWGPHRGASTENILSQSRDGETNLSFYF